MSLYPITNLTLTNALLGSNPIPAGTQIAIPVTMSGNATKIDILQDSTAQDYSLRIWVTTAASNGLAIKPIITVTRPSGNLFTDLLPSETWHAFKDTTNPFVLFTSTSGHGTAANFSTAPGVFYLLVPDGICYINILNLVSEPNSFTLTQAAP